MEPKKVSKCCQAEMIPPMSEEEMEDNYIGNNWRAASCYICKKCGKACEAVEEKSEVVDMKPEQLRKGNLLKNQLDGSLIIVKAYDIYCLEEGMDTCIMQPIPITEEWLVKLGYKSTESYVTAYRLFYINDGNFDGDFIVRFYRDDIDVAPFSKIPVHGRDQFLSISVQYVHQLQNLYFALTGEELTVKV